MGFSVFTWITIFALSAMIVNTIGIWFVYKNGEWAESYKEYFICFAAGVLIASPLIMAFPEAISKNPSAGLAALAGFLFMFISNKLIHNKTKQKIDSFSISFLAEQQQGFEQVGGFGQNVQYQTIPQYGANA